MSHSHRSRYLKPAVAAIVVLALCWAVAGCGNKGPLVHPDPTPAPATSTTSH